MQGQSLFLRETGGGHERFQVTRWERGGHVLGDVRVVVFFRHFCFACWDWTVGGGGGGGGEVMVVVTAVKGGSWSMRMG